MGGPNILLVILDSLRAKSTSLHDYPVVTTPNIEALGERATVYEQARAPGIHSVASHASIFSGYQVEEHGLYEHNSRLDPAYSIWEELSDEHEYTTGLFTPNLVVAEASNLGDHFQKTVGPKRFTHPEKGLKTSELPVNASIREFLAEALRHNKPIQSLLNGIRYHFSNRSAHDPQAESASTYFSEFLDWQQDQAGRWAACVNVMDTHYPFDAKPEFRRHDDELLRSLNEYFDGPPAREVLSKDAWWVLEALEYLYEECILQVDSAIHSLIGELKDRGEFDDTLIVLTSDHGEAFGEYSQVSPRVRLSDHSWGIHEVQTHVPLLVKHPNQESGNRISDAAALTEFPDVVRRTIESDSRPSFVPEGPVFSSTFRVPDAGQLLPANVSKSDYVGPWRAVYTDQDDHVCKQATHGEEGVTVRISSAQNNCIVDRSYPKHVDEVYESLSRKSVDMGLQEMDDELDKQLEALGYLR